MPQRLRIFISSPGDVPDERLRADLIVDKLAQDYSRFFTIAGYRWEHEPMLASGHFQDAVEPPSTFDIVVLILWSRLGTPLPDRTATRDYRGIDGRAPVTGTEWEYEEALKAARDRGAPDILAFRNVSPAPIDPRDVEVRTRSIAQLDALDAFWKRHFADRGIFLGAYDEYRTLEEFARRLEESLRKLIERRIEGEAGLSGAPIWSGAPFRGLAAYEFEHTAIFFGRDGAVAKAAEQLASQARAGSAFLLVSGPSGSGKSSLVKAALVPRLMKPQRISGAAFVRRVVFRPGDGGPDVITGLAEVLTRGAGTDGVGLPELLGPGQDAAQLAAYLRAAVGDPSFVFSAALGRLTQAGRAAGRLLAYEEAKLILVLDQLEELFTSAAVSADQRQLFVRLLAALGRSGAVWVVATIRSDFWHRAAELPELAALAQGFGRLDIAAPSPAELAEMIRKPAQAAGLSFEISDKTGLGLDAVLAEHAASEPGVLPLLSFTLDELYRRDVTGRQGKVLTYVAYEELGQLEGAIATRADQVLAALPPAAQKALPRVLRMLAAVSTGAEQVAVARSARVASFAPGSDARTLVDALTAARLLVASTEGSEPTLRLAHEALISRWTRAREQLISDRRDLETREQVERQQRRWRSADSRAQRQLLLRDPDLANAVDLARRWGDELDADTGKFIQASARRARLRQQLTVVAAAIFGLVAISAVVAAYQAVVARHSAQQLSIEAVRERDRATAQEAKATEARDRATAQEAKATEARDRAVATQSRLLAERASRLTEQGDTLTAMLLSLEAFRSPDDNGPERYEAAAEKSLTDAIYRHALQFVLPGGQPHYVQAAYTHDGSRLVTLDKQGGVTIWSLDADGRPVQKEKRPDLGVVKTILANPTQPILFIRGKDLSHFAWNYRTNEKVKGTAGKCDDDLGSYSDFKFDRSGERLLVWCRQVDVIELATGRAVTKPGPFASFALAGDGKRFVTLRDKTPIVEVWTTATGAPVKSWNAPDSTKVLMSHNGETVYTRFGYYRVRGWKSSTGTVLFQELANPTRSLDIFPQTSGDLLATAGDDGVRVWNGTNGEVIQHLPDAALLNFLPNGLLAVQEDQNITLWDYIVESRLGHLEPKRRAVLHIGTVHNLVTAGVDGKRLVTIGDGSDLYIWRTDPAMLLRANDDAGGCASSIDLSGDGKTIAGVATCSEDTVILWDGGTLAERKRLVFPDYDSVGSVRLSGDARRMLIGVLPKSPGSDTKKEKDKEKDKTRPLSYAVIEVANGKRLFPANGPRLSVVAPDLSADGESVAAASGSNVDLWRVADGLRSKTCQVGDKTIIALAFDASSSRIAVANGSGAVWLLDPATCSAIEILSFGAPVDKVALSYRDGLVRARIGWKDKNDQEISSRLQVWSEREKKVVLDRTSHADAEAPFDFITDGGRMLLPESIDDNVARFVDAGTRQEVGNFTIDPAGCCYLSFLRLYPDQHRLLTGWNDRGAFRLRLWQVLPTLEELRSYARTRVPECLSPEKRRQLGLEPDPPRWCIELGKQPYDTAAWKQWLADKAAGNAPPLPSSGTQ